MSQEVVTRTKTFTAGGAIKPHRLVKLSSGKIALAALGDDPIGVLEVEAFADGDKVAVALLNAQGTIKMEADAAVTEGAKVYGRALGRVDDNSATSAVFVGRAMEKADAQGDLFEVMPSYA